MKPHLPLPLFRALLCACLTFSFGTASLTLAATYPNGSKIYTTQQTDELTLELYESIWFKVISSSSHGGAIYNQDGTFTLRGNGSVTFSGNTSSDYAGAINNQDGTFTLSNNESVTFSGNTSSDYAGAIYNQDGTFTLSNNGSVTFSGNTSTCVAALANSGTFTLSNNGSVTFSGNSVSEDSEFGGGGAICSVGIMGKPETFTLSNNGSVTFIENTASGTAFEYGYNFVKGGAIWNATDEFTLSGNKDVTFSGNSADGGGAIYNNWSFMLSNNGAVTFCGNTASSDDISCGGGAICNLVLTNFGSDNTFFAMVDNGDVTFSRNSASFGGAIFNYILSDFTLSRNEDVSFSENSASNDGGAIFNYESTFTLSNNGSVTFSGNEVSANGGAICNSAMVENDDNTFFALENNGDVTFSGNTDFSDYSAGGAIDNSAMKDNDDNTFFAMEDNGDVTFSGNTATGSSDDGSGYGGAIHNDMGATFTLSDNGGVTFVGNSASFGGAICNYFGSAFTLRGNGDVTFKGNTASSGDVSHGGAIANYGTFMLSGNEDVTFSGNSATDSSDDGSGYGGAIHNDMGATFTLSDNGGVTFIGNTVSGYFNGIGGAICNYFVSAFTLSGNGDVTFRGNTASSGDVSYGGAIYNDGTFTLSGNGDVLFEKNAEICNGTYRLRSIYSLGTLNLSASKDKSITFRDSVYANGTVELNRNGTGRIVFTGLTTAADLYEAKGGVDGTEQEILLSQTSELMADVKLYGGTLAVEDGAVLMGLGLSAVADSDSLVHVKDGTLNHDGYALTFNSNTRLAISGVSSITASSVDMGDGSTLSFLLEAENIDNPVLTLSGDLSLSVGAQLTLDCSSLLKTGTYRMLLLEDGESLSCISVDTVKMLNDSFSIEDAYWDNGTFYVALEVREKEPERVILNTAQPIVNEYSITYQFYHAMLYLQGDWNIAAPEQGQLLDIRWEGHSGEHLSLDGNGAIATHNGWLYCDGGAEFTIESDICLKDTSLSVLDGKVIYKGSVEISPSSWPMEFDVWGQSILDISQADLSTNSGNLMLLLAGGRVVSSNFAVDAHHALQISTIDGNAPSVWEGNLTLEDNGRVVMSADGSYLSVSGDILVNGDTIFLFWNSLDELKVGMTLMTCTGDILGDTSQLRVGVFGENEYTPFGSFSTSGLWVDVLTLETGYALVTSLTKPQSVSHTHTWESLKGIWCNGCSIGKSNFADGDTVIFKTLASVTISGNVAPDFIEVNSFENVVFTSDKKISGSGIGGKGMLTKNGAGVLTLNGGNTYSGGTVLNAGTIKATAADSFGTGEITVKGGTLDLSSKAVSNDVMLAGTATIKGDAKYLGNVSVDGNATLLAKASYKGKTTIGSGNTLTLAAAATLAGSIDVAGGTLNIAADKGLTIAKGMSLTLGGGTVNGPVNVGAGAVLDATSGTLTTAPTLAGGTLTTGGKGSVQLSGTGSLTLGSQGVNLKSKGELRTDEDITITGGKVTLAGINLYNGEMSVQGGTFSLGKVAVASDIAVTGSAVLNNGTLHGGDINVSGELIKGTVIKLTQAGQEVNLNHAGVMNGTISGLGAVNVNANIDASLGKMTNAYLNLNSGTLTNNKGLKLVKGQTLTFGGGKLNLVGKLLTTAAGSTLNVQKSATLSGGLTLAGGELVLADGVNLSVSGALTLSKATTLTLDGTATLTFGTLTVPKKGTLEDFFGVGRDITITRKGNTLTFVGYSSAACAAPETEEFEVVAAAAPEGEVIIITPETVGAPALAVSPAAELAKKAVAERPLGDALVMADWGIVDANRAFTGTLQSRRDSGVVLADGQGMAWVSALGGVSRHGSENGHNGADVNMNGAAVGVEHTAGANSVLGLAVGHTWSRIGATGMQHLRQDTAHVALYGMTKLPHGFTAEWSAAYGDTDSKGSFYGTRETWSQKSTAISARLNKSHDLNDSTAVRGFAGLNYDATDAASIHGMHTGSIQRLQGEVGAGITHRADKLTTYAEASVTTDLARNAPAVDFGAWRQNGATPGRTGLNLTLGAAYELTDKWSINAAYHVEAAERATQHSFNVGAGMKF